MQLLRANNLLLNNVRNVNRVNQNNRPSFAFRRTSRPYKYKWWADPIYVQPVVAPLHRGPDFAFLDGRSPRITHDFELIRRKEHAELAQQIVAYLKEINEAEQLNSEQKQIEERDKKTQEKWSLASKGTTEFS